jgi:hypothetical protein
LAELAEKLAPTIDVSFDTGVLKMYCPGRLPVWRAESFLSKEPETIRWIDSFEKNRCTGTLALTLVYFHFTLPCNIN